MGSPWSELLANVAIVAMFVSVWIHTHVWIDRFGAVARNGAFGLLMGVGVIAVMLVPVELLPGVNVDLRFAMIALSGLFGGPLACLVTGAMAGAFRFYEGGIGTYAGMVSIAAAMIITTTGHLILRGRQPRRTDILLVAAAVAIGSRMGLSVLPMHVVQAYLATAALPSMLLDFASIMLAGLTLYQERVRVEALNSKRIYKAVVETLPDCLNVKDLGGRFIIANPATARLMQAPDTAALIGKTDFDFYPQAAARDFRQADEAAIAAGAPMNIEQHFSHGGGAETWLSTMKTPLADRLGKTIGLISHNRDITRSKELENELAQSRMQLTDALTHMADGLVMFDASGRLLLCNEQYRAMFPATADVRVPGVLNRDILRISAERGEQQAPSDDLEAWIDGIVTAHLAADDRNVELSDGRWLNIRSRPTDNGGSLSMFSDITVAKRGEADLRAANEELNRLAHRDGLTDLWTRRAFDEALEREFGRSRRSRAPLSLLLIDVDWFKRFNDAYGHPAGDACLRAVSRCIEAIARRPTDMAARYGGEEFAVILPETDSGGAFVIAEALKSAVRDLRIGHKGSAKQIVTASIGVATFDGTGKSMDIPQFLLRADEALYGAKAAGRDRVHGWRPHAQKSVRLANRQS